LKPFGGFGKGHYFCTKSIDKFTMRIRKIATLVASIALLSSCEYQKYNQNEQEDVRAGNELIYGVHPDSAARSLANKYEDNPDMDRRANAIREKLFANTPGSPNASMSRLDTTAAAPIPD
jgi:hypothetical protein